MNNLASDSEPENKRLDLISEFHRDYSEALDRSRVGSKHTETEGWQTLYKGRQSEDLTRMAGVATRLKNLADTLESIGSSDESEKAIGECKKTAETARRDREVFDRRVVESVKEPVMECQRIIQDFRQRARREEEQAPLHNVGLDHLMRDAIASVAKVDWDADAGRIVIAEAPSK